MIAHKFDDGHHVSQNTHITNGSAPAPIKKLLKKLFYPVKQLKHPHRLLFVLMFLMCAFIAVPLSSTITYMQNDDYIHYKITQKFMAGDFTLDPYIAATFYTQGLLGAGWANLVGIQNLPVLTALVYALGCAVFAVTLSKFYVKNTYLAGGLALLYALSPLVVYSAFGYMTEAYFMLFLLGAFYFLKDFERTSRHRFLVLGDILILLGFFVRQNMLALLVASSLTFALRKKFKAAALQFGLIVLLVVYYTGYFPQTPQMRWSIQPITALGDIRRDFVVFRIVIEYLGVFLVPVFLYAAQYVVINFKKHILVVGFALLAFFISADYFTPGSIITYSRETTTAISRTNLKAEFPYFGNVFSRTGFLETNLEGTKYHYPGYFKLFKGFELIGTISFCIFLCYIVSTWRSADSLASWYLVCSVGLLLLAQKYYDRYIIALIPLTILVFVPALTRTNRYLTYLGMLYLAGMTFLTYQYTADYYLVNTYVWKRSQELVKSGVLPEAIKADNSWIKLHESTLRNRTHILAYPESSKATSGAYQIIDKYQIDYPFNFYLGDHSVLLLQKMPSTVAR